MGGSGTDLRFGFQDIEHRARLHHIALSDKLLDDHACTGRGQLDGRLVGHHLDHRLVFGHALADRDKPFRDLGLGEALADVWKAKFESRHSTTNYSRVVARIASSTRSGLGRYCSSSICTG